MASNYHEMLKQVNAVNRGIAVVSQSLASEIERQASAGMDPEKVRAAGHELVSLAGRLTVLGVDIARSAEDTGRADGGAR